MLQESWALESDLLQNDPRNRACIGLEASYFIGEISVGIPLVIKQAMENLPFLHCLSSYKPSSQRDFRRVNHEVFNSPLFTHDLPTIHPSTTIFP